jgi:hypothetical protein
MSCDENKSNTETLDMEQLVDDIRSLIKQVNTEEENSDCKDQKEETTPAPPSQAQVCYDEFKKLVKLAKSQRVQTPDGNVYSISQELFDECTYAHQDLVSAITTEIKMLQEFLSESKHDMYGHLTGLQYVFQNPTPKQRLHFESESEHGDMMQNMFGIGNSYRKTSDFQYEFCNAFLGRSSQNPWGSNSYNPYD